MIIEFLLNMLAIPVRAVRPKRILVVDDNYNPSFRYYHPTYLTLQEAMNAVTSRWVRYEIRLAWGDGITNPFADITKR